MPRRKTSSSDQKVSPIENSKTSDSMRLDFADDEHSMPPSDSFPTPPNKNSTEFQPFPLTNRDFDAFESELRCAIW